MPSYPFRSHSQDSPGADPVEAALAGDESLVELRCAVIVARGEDVLLLRRPGEGPAKPGRPDGEVWVLPGGRPRPGEGMLACARREVAEETGVVVMPDRCAFVADVIAPDRGRRCVELVFVARVGAREEVTLAGEHGVEPAWMSLERVRQVNLRPPIAGFLPDVVRGRAQTAPYLGNLWRPEGAENEPGHGSGGVLDDATRPSEPRRGTWE
ncbi:MAG: NUDIX hydrolase [Nocardioides sp.]|uniref:NUDIX hydrolase n=1 Tax=Nocardioides sp. TaxID=35761 RepID=UPI0039E3DB01